MNNKIKIVNGELINKEYITHIIRNRGEEFYQIMLKIPICEFEYHGDSDNPYFPLTKGKTIKVDKKNIELIKEIVTWVNNNPDITKTKFLPDKKFIILYVRD